MTAATNTYQLYYMPGACSMAVHSLLTELNQPFTLTKVTHDDKSEILKVNTRGSVPVLVTPDGTIIREGAAIISWLCDTHAAGQTNISWPANGAGRAAALEWLAFANSTLHPAYSTAMFLKRTNAAPEIQQQNQQKIEKLWAEVEQRLATSTYICGDTPTPADILMTVIANWQAYISQPVAFGPNCKRLFAAISGRPSYQTALEAEGVTYKAAA